MSRPYPLCLFFLCARPKVLLFRRSFPRLSPQHLYCSTCAVTVVIFEHFSHSLLLTYFVAFQNISTVWLIPSYTTALIMVQGVSSLYTAVTSRRVLQETHSQCHASCVFNSLILSSHIIGQSIFGYGYDAETILNECQPRFLCDHKSN